MNAFIIILIVLILIIPLWALLSGGEKGISEDSGPDSDHLPGSRPFSGQPTDLEEPAPGNAVKQKPAESEAPQNDMEVGEDFNLPHEPGEIIPLDSPFSIYSKTLANAETYIKNGDFNTARSLYEGIHDRISDASTRRKIEENLDYINNYHQLASQRLEAKKKKERDNKEIRFTLEGAESFAERVQISIAPEKPLIDIDNLVKNISEKLSGTSVQSEGIAAKALEQYRDEISAIKGDLKEVTRLKDDIRKLNEDKLRNDIEEIDALKSELKSLRDNPSNIDQNPAEKFKEEISRAADEIALKKEEQILESIKHREDENRLLKDRLDLMQREMSMLREENAKTAEIEDILSTKLDDLSSGSHASRALQNPDSSVSGKVDESDALREELAQLKNYVNELASNVKSDSSITAPGETARPQADVQKNEGSQRGDFKPDSSVPAQTGAARQQIDLLKKDEKKEENKKDDFQLMDELINGPRFDEPTDEEVLEKILNDAVKEHAKKTEKHKKEDDEKTKARNTPKEDLKEDFELMSDYMREDEGIGPTDDEVMEKILKDAMKSKEFRHSESHGANSIQSDFAASQQRKRKELPILRVTYNFSRLPDEFTLSIDKNNLEHSFYKYKPLLEKANDLVKRRKVKDAINYFRVVMDQDIPKEFQEMLEHNIKDLNEYLTKYYTS